MSLEISTLQSPAVAAKTKYCAGGNMALDAGRQIKLRLTSPGEELLDLTVPAGQTWRVQVAITIDVE